MNFKILIFEILLLFILDSTNGQQWIRIYEDTVSIEISKVMEQYDKGYIFTGQRYEGGSYYGWLLKTNINGDVRWSKTYGISLKMNQFVSSRIIDDGGLIICGLTNNLSASCSDPLIIKVNACGEKDWCKIYNAQGCNSWVQDIEIIPGNGYMALIKSWKIGEEQRIWLFRLDNIGEVIWAQVYATDPEWNSEWSHSLLKTTDSCYVITGETYYPDPTYPNKKIIKIILIKVDLDGKTIFEVPWGTKNGVYSDGRLSTFDSKNNIFTAGRRARTITPGGDSPCLFKTSPNGNPVFYKDLKTNSILGISTTINWFQDSTLAICSQWKNSSGLDTTGVIKTDSLGIYLNQIAFPDNYGIYGSDITFNNRLILGGTGYNSGYFTGCAIKLTADLEYDSVYTTPFTYDSLCEHPIVSDTIPLDDCEVVVVSIDEALKNPETTKLHVYPNPANEQVTIEMPKFIVRLTGGQVDKNKTGFGISATTIYYQWNTSTLEIYNLFGKLMYSKEIPKKTERIELEVDSWNGGMYVVRVVYMQDIVASAKFVIKIK